MSDPRTGKALGEGLTEESRKSFKDIVKGIPERGVRMSRWVESVKGRHKPARRRQTHQIRERTRRKQTCKIRKSSFRTDAYLRLWRIPSMR
jgi:hypothetical protein